jgi:hypothetical protein
MQRIEVTAKYVCSQATGNLAVWLGRRLFTPRLGCGTFYSPGRIALGSRCRPFPRRWQCHQFAIGLGTDNPKSACAGAATALSTLMPWQTPMYSIATRCKQRIEMAGN